jgi:hypothetical protein
MLDIGQNTSEIVYIYETDLMLHGFISHHSYLWETRFVIAKDSLFRHTNHFVPPLSWVFKLTFHLVLDSLHLGLFRGCLPVIKHINSLGFIDGVLSTFLLFLVVHITLLFFVCLVAAKSFNGERLSIYESS